ncbi:MAG: PKD domain-containing protein, partial [Bacteroidota bacterium]
MIKYVLGIFLFLSILCKPGFAQPVADFQSDTVRGCAPIIVNFFDQSTNATSWSWDLGNVTSSLKNPSTAYSQPGMYTIRLIVTDDQGRKDTLTRQNYIEILPAPEVSFSYDRTEDCQTTTYSFSNTSITATPISSYSWDFGDGSISSDNNPENTFSGNGSFPVTLIIETEAGCSGFTFDTLNIQSGNVDASFYADTLVSCGPPFTVQFSGNAPAGSTEKWDFGDGFTTSTANPVHTYTSIGSYSVTHIITDPSGCADTVVEESYVNIGSNTLKIEVDKEVSCLGDVVTLKAFSPIGSQISWDLGDSTFIDSVFSLNHTYDTTGTYTIKVEINVGKGCIVNEGLTLSVKAPPEAGFTFDPSISSCHPPYEVAFTDTSSGASSWLWEFGDGTTSVEQHPTHQFQTDETFVVKLSVTDSLGCVSGEASADTVNSPFLETIVKEDKRGGCIPFTVSLSDSILRGGPITSYRWEVEGLPISTDPSPSFVLADTGRFDVKLIAENAAGCLDTIFLPKYLSAGSPPNIDFEPAADSVCPNSAVLIENLSVGGEQYVWYFDTGDSIVSIDLLNAFDRDGDIDVTLVGWNKGCKASLTKNAAIFIKPPIPDFIPSVAAVCELPFEVSFTNASIEADKYLWNLGNGLTSTDENVSITFTEPGYYYISLTAINEEFECQTTYGINLPVIPAKADFSLPDSTVCAPYPAVPVNLSDSAISWHWYFGEGDTIYAENPQYGFFHPGTYDISLMVQNQFGCRDTLVRKDYLTTYKPLLGFTVKETTAGCPPFTVEFLNETSAQTSGISYEWILEDSIISTLENPIHTFGEPGYYDIVLTATDSLGCTKSLYRPQYIFVSKPTPDFYAPFSQNCPGNTVSFINTSEGYGLTYEWDFGDGNTSTLANPEHIYEHAGIYNIQLRVTDVNGCDSTIIKEDYIRINPFSIDFFTDTTFTECPPLAVTFQADSSTQHGNISWFWDFGTGATSVLPLAQHLYTLPGEYDVQLIGMAESGCADTVLREEHIIIEGPYGTFSFSPLAGCPGLEVQFESVVDEDISLQWLTGDGTLLPIGQNTYSYPYSGTYSPLMALTDSAGCTTLISSDTTVEIHSLPTISIASTDTLFCTAQEVTFSIPDTQESPLIQWTWDLGDGVQSSSATPTHIYDAEGNYQLGVIAVNEFGCVDSSIGGLTLKVLSNEIPQVLPIDRVTVMGETDVLVEFQADNLSPLYFERYHIYKENALGEFEVLDSLTQREKRSFKDGQLTTSTQSYCYLVQSETICNTRSPLTDSAKHCTIDIEHLSGDERVEVFWTPYIGWESVQAYRIFRTFNIPGWQPELIGEVSGDQTLFIDSTTFCEQEYVYEVEAISANSVRSRSDTTIGKAYHVDPSKAIHMINATVVNNEEVQIEWEIPNFDMWKELIV